MKKVQKHFLLKKLQKYQKLKDNVAFFKNHWIFETDLEK